LTNIRNVECKEHSVEARESSRIEINFFYVYITIYYAVMYRWNTPILEKQNIEFLQ